MRLIFMGTPEFAVAPLLALHAAGHKIAACYTQPPRPAGRGQQLRTSPVQLAAEQLRIPVLSPRSLKSEEAQAEFAAFAPDLAIVAAYGLILPAKILAIPKLGCVNIHASLLPRWRGAAPIQRAIMAGDAVSGITLMQMDVGLDTGAVLTQSTLALAVDETASSLHDRLMIMGAEMIVPLVTSLAKGAVPAQPQPEIGVTYAHKLEKSEGAIDWCQSATMLDRQIRALTPWPSCFFRYGDEMIKILSCTPSSGSGQAGELLDPANCLVACGEGALSLRTVQRAGKAPISGSDFINGLRLPKGVIFGHGSAN
jgi:methionyl-tRNA formyltransferase